MAKKGPGERLSTLGLLNLMPNKAETEVQWLRLLQQTNTVAPLSLRLLKFADWQPTSTSALYMSHYYQPIEKLLVAGELDGLIITGAPVGQIGYEEVLYWQSFQALVRQLAESNTPCFFSCWAANAALYVLYGIPTLRRTTKLSGLFMQDWVSPQGLTAGVTAPCWIPQSRYALPQPKALQKACADTDLSIAMSGPESGPSVLYDDATGHAFVLGHLEYDADTLAREYQRDLKRDPTTPLPQHYFIDNNPAHLPTASWQSSGVLVLQNWLTQLNQG